MCHLHEDQGRMRFLDLIPPTLKLTIRCLEMWVQIVRERKESFFFPIYNIFLYIEVGKKVCDVLFCHRERREFKIAFLIIKKKIREFRITLL